MIDLNKRLDELEERIENNKRIMNVMIDTVEEIQKLKKENKILRDSLAKIASGNGSRWFALGVLQTFCDDKENKI